MEGAESSGEALVVAGQTPEAGGPCEASLHHPAARQQDKASFCLSMFDHFQLDAMLFSGFRRRFAGIP